MSGDAVTLLLVAMLGLWLGAWLGGKDGRIEGACAVRWEYATTAADSLTIYREHPECAS